MPSLRAVLVPVVLLAFSGSLEQDEILFRVSAETTLVRTLQNAYTMELDSMTLTMNGEDVPAEHFGEVDIHIQREEHYVVTDTFESVAEGRPQRLLRTFDELGCQEHTRFSFEDGDESEDSEYESSLEGQSVVFTWNEETGEFDAAFHESAEGEAELLEELEEDMDLRRLLPNGSVAEGDTWEIDVAAFQCILDPGGDLALVDSEGAGEDTSAKDAELRANLAGTLTATYRGTEEEDGVRQAVIALAADTHTHADDALDEDEVPEGATGTGRIEVAFRLEGELRWDLEHGHALSLELSGENDLSMRQTLTGDSEGENITQSQTMMFGGEMSLSMKFERR